MNIRIIRIRFYPTPGSKYLKLNDLITVKENRHQYNSNRGRFYQASKVLRTE